MSTRLRAPCHGRTIWHTVPATKLTHPLSHLITLCHLYSDGSASTRPQQQATTEKRPGAHVVTPTPHQDADLLLVTGPDFIVHVAPNKPATTAVTSNCTGRHESKTRSLLPGFQLPSKHTAPRPSAWLPKSRTKCSYSTRAVVAMRCVLVSIRPYGKSTPGQTGTANRLVYGLRCLPKCVHLVAAPRWADSDKTTQGTAAKQTASAAVGTAHLCVPASGRSCLRVRKTC